MSPYDEEMRRRISKNAEGKTIESMTWDPVDRAWCLLFTDGTQMWCRLMAELSLDGELDE